MAIGLPSLRGADLLDVLRRATDRFGRLQPVAIVLRGRRASEADYFTELVAAQSRRARALLPGRRGRALLAT